MSRKSKFFIKTLSAPMRALALIFTYDALPYPSAGYITAILVISLSYSPVRFWPSAILSGVDTDYSANIPGSTKCT